MKMALQQIEAILFGLALGDALGYPVEFMKLADIRQTYGHVGIQELPNPALYSDDTQMTLALAEGMLDAGINAPLDSLMQGVGNRFIKWRESPENNRAPGTTCINGVNRFQSGISWRESGIVESKGCGSAMRVAPLGYLYQHDEARLREVAVATSQITHRHPTAIAATVAAAYLVKLALDGVSTSDYMPRLYDFTTGISDEFDLAILRVGHVLGWMNEDLALDHIGQGWTGEEAVALALYCVLRYPDDYVACVHRAANTNGDSDSIACIAGGIMGARLGLDAIPSDWRLRCENAAMISDIARRLAVRDA
ncbi:MAG: ADP-ribosylglycohydrolase family protein [Anaerolineaceae bacterium]|nr:ADP-ribosylglycohydrolase family protein [Anaerolineaceae bacterium]